MLGVKVGFNGLLEYIHLIVSQPCHKASVAST